MRDQPVVASLILAAAGLSLTACGSTSDEVTHRTVTTAASVTRDPERTPYTTGPPTTATTTSSAASTTTTPGPPADQRRLSLIKTITGDLTPKSIVATETGLMFAQNMIYSHTINVYDRSFRRVAQIDDRVDLTDFGWPGGHRGGPVEAAVSADRRHVYVTNYEMSGPGFTNPGNDRCSPGKWDPSFVYRVSLDRLEIDQIIQVGPVPKYIAVTPDGKWVLNSNWCAYDLSVIDAEAGREVRRVPLGRFPRGIAVRSDSSVAYVAVMGSSDIAKVDLASFAVTWIRGVGRGPRHLVLSPDDRYLYATLNGEGTVVKIDTTTDRVVGRVSSPSQPRSMAISPDGTALYVVNYASDATSKIATADMRQIQRVPTNHHPIGVAYDDATATVWVACYSGSIQVFADR
jgi:YVTN family beta-propeller protein